MSYKKTRQLSAEEEGDETETDTATDTGSEFEGSPFRSNGSSRGKNQVGEGSPKNEGGSGENRGQGKALKWVRGTFCKFAKA